MENRISIYSAASGSREAQKDYSNLRDFLIAITCLGFFPAVYWIGKLAMAVIN